MRRKQIAQVVVITGGVLVGRALLKTALNLIFPDKKNQQRQIFDVRLDQEPGQPVTYVNDAEFDENGVDNRQVVPAMQNLTIEGFEDVIMDEEFELGCHQLFCAIFGNRSQVLTAWQSRRKLQNVDNGWWVVVNGQKQRRIYYELRVRNPLAPDYANTTEQQTIVKKEDNCFIVEIVAYTPNVPFGTSFHSIVKLCGWQLEEGRCRIQGTVRVIFNSANWLKGTIKKSTISGSREAYTVLTSVLQEGVGVPIPPQPEIQPLIKHVVQVDRQYIILMFLTLFLVTVFGWAFYIRYSVPSIIRTTSLGQKVFIIEPKHV